MKGRGRKKGGSLKALFIFALGLVAGAALLLYIGPERLNWKGLRGLVGGSEPTPPPARVPTAARPSPHPSPTPKPVLPADFEVTGKRSKGVLAFVLDDIGHDDGSLARLKDVAGPLALAVLPGSPRAADAARLAKSKGWDLLVHLPMEPSNSRSKEALAVGPEDDDPTIKGRVRAAIEAVPAAIGLNNHQGSLATADRRVVRAVLSVVRDRGLFFLDSRTTPASVAEREARALGISTLSRDVFLDDARKEAETEGGPEAALAEALSKAMAIAVRKGHAVVIGHPHASTLTFLTRRLPELAGEGYRRVRVSELAE